MHIVVPFGFYGAGNIGDEATLQGFARLLAEQPTHPRVSVSSRNPVHTARAEPAFGYFHCKQRDPRRWLAKLGASAHAMVGGTPIMDVLGDWPFSELVPLVRSIDRWKVPLSFIGIGTETLRRQESRRLVAEEIAPRTRHWSVRCDRDRQRLLEYGVAPDAVTVAADMAWLIEAAPIGDGRERLKKWGADVDRPLIGVNLVNENRLLDEHPQLVTELARALDELAVKMDAQVLFLSNEIREDDTFDRAAAAKVMAQMQRSDQALLMPNEYLAPQEMMSIIGCCSLTMSMRYHFCLFSALQGVPFIAIERTGKISDLCWDLNWTARVVPPEFSAADLVEHGKELLQIRPALQERLQQNVEMMRQRARRNAVAVDVLTTSDSSSDFSIAVRRIRGVMTGYRS